MKSAHTLSKQRGVFPRSDILFALPGVAGFLAFFVLPFFGTIFYSLIRSSFDFSFAGAAHYISTWNNAYYRLALKNTLIFCGALIPFCVFGAFLLALLVRGAGNIRFGQLAFLLPAFLPSSAIVVSWKLLFYSENSVLHLLSSSAAPEWILLFLLTAWKSIGIVMMLLLSALSGIPKDIEGAAEIDGANAVQKARYILLPSILPVLLGSMIYQLMLGLRSFKEAYLLYGAYPVAAVYQVQHYMNNHFNKLNYQRLSSGAVIFSAFTLLLLVPFLIYLSRRER